IVLLTWVKTGGAPPDVKEEQTLFSLSSSNAHRVLLNTKFTSSEIGLDSSEATTEWMYDEYFENPFDFDIDEEVGSVMTIASGAKLFIEPAAFYHGRLFIWG